MSKTVLYNCQNGIGRITLNRPDVLNALNGQLTEDFLGAITLATEDESCRCIILEGNGKHFMAGGDIAWFSTFLDLSPEDRKKHFTNLLPVVHKGMMMLHDAPQPVIARVHGAVAGFGLSLMLAADLAVASEDAYFTLAYRHIGTTPDGGGTFSLPRMVGMKAAKEIALLGGRFDAEKALDLGIINKIVPIDELEDAALEMARKITSGPATVLARTKALLNNSLQNNLATQLKAEEQFFATCSSEDDFVEGIQAFLAKRPAKFTNAT